MKEKWILSKDNCDILAVSKELNIPFYLTKVISNRGITDIEDIRAFLETNVESLYNPDLLPDVDLAVSILSEAIENNTKIRIIGDYDVDGVMATFIFYDSLKRLTEKVDFVIPDRIEDGYGLSKDLIDNAVTDGVELILTCDNGISAFDEVQYALSMGISLIITDHHDIPIDAETGEEILPEADAVIDIKMRESMYPFSGLCGASVVYKFMKYVYKELNIYNAEFEEYLQYASIATICDVMEIVDENRVIVKLGLDLLSNTKNAGLIALKEILGLKDKTIESSDVAFSIGPVLNSAGRLESAHLAMELLLSNDFNSYDYAKKLQELNDRRKYETKKGVEEALQVIEREMLFNDKIIVAKLDKTKESVIGIIAGRIKDLYDKPVIILTDSSDEVKGSARSIDGYNIYEELSNIKEYFSKFGGHKMAAGMSLDKENIGIIRNLLNENYTNDNDEKFKLVNVDMKYSLGLLNRNFIQYLELLKPYGNGNERPIFADLSIQATKLKVLGKNKNVVKLDLITKQNTIIEGIMFNKVKEFLETIKDRYGENYLNSLQNGISEPLLLDILYYPEVNTYMGNSKIQINVKNYRFA